MKIIKEAIFYLVAFSLVLSVADVFIKTSYVANVSPTEFYDDIGRGRRRNLPYVYFNEGFGIGKFNEYRYIGEAHSPAKHQNTFRVAMLGDSYIESFQVFDRNYFGNIAEKLLLENNLAKKVEILNFGRSGFDIADMYVYHKEFVDKFDPDLVLYMLSRDDLAPRVSDPLVPTISDIDGKLLIDKSFNEKEVEDFNKYKALIQNSCFLNMLNLSLKKTKKVSVGEVILGELYRFFIPTGKDSGECKENEANLVVEDIAYKIVDSFDPNKVVVVNRGRSKIPEEFESYCRKKQIYFFDLSDKLNEMSLLGVDPNEWAVTGKTGHWNVSAHKMIGHELAHLIHKKFD